MRGLMFAVVLGLGLGVPQTLAAPAVVFADATVQQAGSQTSQTAKNAAQQVRRGVSPWLWVALIALVLVLLLVALTRRRRRQAVIRSRIG